MKALYRSAIETYGVDNRLLLCFLPQKIAYYFVMARRAIFGVNQPYLVALLGLLFLDLYICLPIFTRT